MVSTAIKHVPSAEQILKVQKLFTFHKTIEAPKDQQKMGFDKKDYLWTDRVPKMGPNLSLKSYKTQAALSTHDEL